MSTETVVRNVPCSCCREPIEFIDFRFVRRDENLGPVCDYCHFALRAAAAWMKHSCDVRKCMTVQRG